MRLAMTAEQLTALGVDHSTATTLVEQLHYHLKHCESPESAWQRISKLVLSPALPFAIHLYVFTQLFPHWHEQPETAPAVIPTNETIQKTNLYKFHSALKLNNISDVHRFSTEKYSDFWKMITEQLGIIFKHPYHQVCDLSNGIESPQWFKDGKLNITDSCFQADPTATAIIYEDEAKHLCHMSYKELNDLSNQIANSLVQLGFQPGDAMGIAMPMNRFAIAIYLGIIKMGGVVISIADSFSPLEIATRLNITKVKIVFTQDTLTWAGKTLPLYEKIISAKDSILSTAHVVVLQNHHPSVITLQESDIAWSDFLVTNTQFNSLACDPMTACNILFSSGTTSEPKAIAWNHTTPIKAASDAFFHQNIQPGDVLAWPTNLGWMMGPWLIFASLINKAAIALYPDAPKDEAFGQFVSRAKVTMLGVVPTLVASWRQTGCMEKIDWRAIKCFSSTGECSNAEDMLYLMSLAHYQPVIEYCGGTEIGGAYISSTLAEKNYPSLFTTPTMGMQFKIIDDKGHEAKMGEVAIIPPSIGLSTTLLNADHHRVYFENMPSHHGIVLRRHGDQLKALPHHLYSIQGRVDDSMNLGGIKVSAAEIERAIAGIEHITETAAIAFAENNRGPSQLIIFAIASKPVDQPSIQKEMQKRINKFLNPLFKISDLLFVESLPKTASNKIMRRLLRDDYQRQHQKTHF